MRTSNRQYNHGAGRPSRSPGKRRNGCSPLTVIAVIISVVLVFLLIRGCFKMVGDYLGSVSDSIAKQQYPIKYKEYVEKYSRKYDLDKYLVYAVIRTESKFDQYAVSSAGAYGLMQLQEETASDCARKLKMKVALPDDLYDPDINIHLGTYYLSWLLKRYDGNIDLAIAAYNGGIGNVDSWLNDNRYSDGSGGLKNIPFGETENYVTGVSASYAKYKEIYD